MKQVFPYYASVHNLIVHVLYPSFTLVLLFLTNPVNFILGHSISTVEKFFKHFNKTSSLCNDFYFKIFSISIKDFQIY